MTLLIVGILAFNIGFILGAWWASKNIRPSHLLSEHKPDDPRIWYG